jgi:hypothetical protein
MMYVSDLSIDSLNSRSNIHADRARATTASLPCYSRVSVLRWRVDVRVIVTECE